MRVLILGGDGFCGWPAALHLSATGHEVHIVDNLVRRQIDGELGLQSLTPISDIDTRLSVWESVSGRQIKHSRFDVAKDYSALYSLITTWEPNAIVHYAEQRSAPYSMRSPTHKRYTVANNVRATHNVVCCIVESGLDVHLIHLGTMGVYGYSGDVPIPEGYQRARLLAEDGTWHERDILAPTDPGSVYHTTKAIDQLLFAFYNKNDRIRVSDLHQGVVWGTNTEEALRDERLINRFDYDGDFGTVLNRFVVQAAIGHPLTVYGTGGQTRAFIHIRDSVECIRLAVENPPAFGQRVRILNQMTEVHRVRDLAQLVSQLTGAKIAMLHNPRKEVEENELNVVSVGLRKLGLKPTTLANALLGEILDVAQKYSARIDVSKIPPKVYWTKEQQHENSASPHATLAAE